ncbi:MAG: UvrD-helicase domain-containing protein, partial [Verrucomicrobiota bacterium]
MTALIDQASRERFLEAAERNFSVIAPAGVGKTTAIVRRIVRIAQHDAFRVEPLLPHLVVVTYTSKAAQELQDRARQELLSDASLDEQLLRGFNRAFFGTIHSFCLELLRRHGHHLGLTPGLGLIEDDAALWHRFLRAQDTLSELIPPQAREDYLRLMPLGKVLALVREGIQGPASAPTTPRPCLELDTVLAYEAKGRAAETVKRSQEALRSWANALEGGARALEIPQPQSKAKEFAAAWTAALQPLQDWLAGHTLAFAQAVAKRYRSYRLEHGQLSYDDMIALAEQLLQHPRALAEIRARQLRIILDEAQDTDPAQFRILTTLACPEGDYGAWPGTGAPPRGGHFCMVGDPQQAIYSQRADLDSYLAVHEALVEDSSGEALTFEVTMRCDRDVVAAVNASFPAVLTGLEGQVALVPLTARPEAGSGDVERLELQLEAEVTRKSDRLQAEAEAIARWLSRRQPSDLGVANWGEVALLAPRKDALDSLEQALLHEHLPVQNHGRKALQGDEPTFAWSAALLYVLAHPADGFELFGVLREVFTLNDGEMAQAVSDAQASGAAHPLQLEMRSDLPGDLGNVLNLLYGLRLRCMQLPLREAFDTAVEQTRLPARLAALPETKQIQIDKGIARLRLDATLAEAEGLSLAAFAKRLYAQASAGPSEATAEPDKLQLMTCLKAKGLE